MYEVVHCANDFLREYMILIDGKKIAAELREELRQEVIELKAKYNKVPGLTVILIGDMAPSQIYVRMKEKAANEVGLKSEVIRYPEAVKEKTVLDKIEELNKDESISGILVQLPLPKHIDKQKVIETILPGKDVDGFHPMNVGNLSSGYESSVPCTPLGCYLMIKKIEPNLSGKKAVMIGRSNLNGKPMAQLLLKENCTVTITHSKTKDLKAECLEADIIVAACVKMGSSKTGALIVLERNNNLDFLISTGDEMNIQVTQPILESIFFKNSPLHDGAIIISKDVIKATRVILPVNNEKNIPSRFGLRHRAAIGITEKTDAVCITVSEESGQISYIMDGNFVLFDDIEELNELLERDLSS